MVDIVETLRQAAGPLSPVTTPTGGSGSALDFSSWTARQLRTGRPGIPGTDAPAPAAMPPEAPAVPTIVTEKQQELRDISESKRQALAATPNPIADPVPAQPQSLVGSLQDFTSLAQSRATGSGAATRSEMDQDVLTLRPDQLRAKYGPDLGNQLFRMGMAGQSEYNRIQAGQRETNETIADAVVDTGQAFVGGFASLGALGAGLAGRAVGADNVGPWLSTKINEANDFVDRNQSNVSQERAALLADRNRLTTRDNAALVEADTVERGEFGAGVRNIARNAVDAIANTVQDPVAFGSGMSAAVGSMLGAAPLARGIERAGAALIPETTRRAATIAAEVNRATGTPSVIRALESAARGIPMTASIAAQEGAGAYQQSAAEVMEMTHEKLLKTSDLYNELLSEANPNDPQAQLAAKQEVANRAGLRAAAIQAPVAAATGALVAKFEANPFSVTSLRRAGDNLIREFTEEGIQGGMGTYAQNQAIKSLADNTRDLTEGVGEAVGTGALFGLGAAAVTQAPGAAARLARNTAVGAANATLRGASAVVDSAKEAVRPLADRLVERGREVLRRNEEAVSVPDAQVQTAAADLDAMTPDLEPVLREAVAEVATTPEQQTESTQYVDDLVSANKFDEAMLSDPEMPETVRVALEGTVSKVDAIQRLAQVVNDNDVLTPEGQFAGFELYALVKSMSDFAMRDPEGLNNLPADHPAQDVMRQFDAVMTNIANTASVKKALRAIDEMMTRESQIVSPKGVVAQAERNPTSADPVAVASVIAQAREGKIKLTQAELASLVSAESIIASARNLQAEREKMGIVGKVDGVGGQVLTNKGVYAERLSASGHSTRIFNAMRANNPKQAAAFLEDFGKFVQHMQNKVSALNTSFEKGGTAERYEALSQRDRSFGRSAEGLTLHSKKAGSIEFAQRAYLEAKALADVYNGLRNAMPQLNVPEIVSAPLNPALMGNARDLANRFANPPKAKPAEPTQLVGKIGKVTPKPVVAPVEAIARAVEEAPKVTEPVVETKPSMGTERIRKMTDEQLNDELNKLIDKKRTPVEEATFNILDNEMTRREDEVAKQQAEEAEPEVTETTDPMDQVFPNLAAGQNNRFKKSYKLPKEAKSTLVGDETPAKTTAEIINTDDRYDDVIAGAYSDYLENVPKLVKSMNDAIKEFLKGTTSKGEYAGKSLAERFALGVVEANRLVGGKGLNIAELQEDGSYKYNQNLIESAVLAGLQWNLTADQLGAHLDESTVASMLDVEASMVQEDTVEMLDIGMSPAEAKMSLARKITDYWGVTVNRNAPDGYTKGIAEGVAADLLEAMTAQGMIKTETFYFDKDGVYLDPKNRDPESKRARTIIRVVPQNVVGESGLNTVKDVIDKAVLTDPEEAIYFGSKVASVSPTQMRNPIVQNTKGQKAAIKAANAVTYRANVQMLNIYNNMSLDAFQNLFGNGKIEEDNLNRNHFRTLEGKANNLEQSYKTLRDLKARLEFESKGGDIGAVEIHYGHNMSRVGRLQQLGKNTPQSSKAVREAILPTWSTLDMSKNTNEDFRMFMLAMGQHFDIKVHKQSLDKTVDQAMALLEGKLAPAVTLVQGWNNSGVINDSDIDELKRILKNAKVPNSPAVLHSLSEYGRFLQTNNKAAFETSAYVEADGVTNGPINAMNLLTYGEFTADWVKTVGKGGLYFKQNGPKNLNDHYEGYDSKDTYQATTDVLGKLLGGKDIETNDPKLRALKFVMGNFNKDLKIDEKGNLLMSRGIAKNPLTITIYGSSAMGIAGKMTSTTMTAIYEKLSEARVAMKADPKLTLAQAMFGDSAFNEDADAKFAKFQSAFRELTGQRFENVDTKNFTLSPEASKVFNNNMLSYFVEPMVEAITATIGQPLMDSAVLLRKAVQVQGIMMQYAFAAKVRAKVAEKLAEPGTTYKKDDFLSADEQMEILNSLMNMGPLIETADQSFFIAGNQSTDVDEVNFSASMSGGYRTSGYVYGPKDPGVAGIPTLVIGMGDGMMMQKLSPQVKNALLVFDGANFDLKNLKGYSTLANKAVYDSWQANPVREVLKSYDQFMKTLDFTGMPPAQVKALEKALLPSKQRKGKTTALQFQALMDEIYSDLDYVADSIDARHAAIARIEVWVDQMASAASPYKSNGVEKIDAVTDQEVADQLNVFYNQEFRRILDAKENAKPKVEDTTEVVLTPPAMRTLDATQTQELLESMKLSNENKLVMDQIMQSKGVQTATVILGSQEQIIDYLRQNGRAEENILRDEKPFGLFIPDTNTVLVMNNSKETLIHELIHAATYNQVFDHYDGKSSSFVAGAIGRIEALMNQFIGLAAANPAMVHAQQVINTQLAAGNKALALNEYMAWTLSNKEIAQFQGTQTATGLAKIVSDSLRFLKKLIFGNAKADDMFSELVFNTGLIAKGATSTFNPDMSAMAHASFGNDERAATLLQTFKDKIEDYIRAPTKANLKEVSARQTEQKNAVERAVELAIQAQSLRFDMTPQQAGLFVKLVAALGTQAQIDPNSMVRAQELYAHVTKGLTVEDFMADPQDDTQRPVAQDKYSFIMGDFGTKNDKLGRSSLLPVFLGLATTSDSFRELLAKKPLPKTVMNQNDSLDNILENVGNTLMDKLSDTMAGPRNAKNVQEAIDSLQDRIVDMSQNSETFVDQLAAPAGNIIDGLNQSMIDLAGKASAATIRKANAVIANTSNTYVKFLANSAKMLAMVSNDESAESVAMDMNERMNKVRGFEPLRDLLGDLIGRNAGNANVYDMIKAVKSYIQQNRQQFRENVPTILDKKFNRKMSEQNWASLYTSMGKTDLATLTEFFSNEQILDMLANRNAISQNITTLENFLSSADPVHWNQVQAKARQLTNFMKTGQTGSMLLRNATSIAMLNGQSKRAGRAKPNQSYISGVDQLVTMYALEALSQKDKDLLSDLAANEKEGLTFTLAYLNGQRKEELRKTRNGPAVMDHYKGFIPETQQIGASLVLANAAEGKALLERSYVKVGDYLGSQAERSNLGMAYYFAPVSARPPFEQGILQNVRRTASGVDMGSGYTEGMTAGRIMEPTEVARITRMIGRESTQTTEQLMPLFDEKGNVRGYERSINPNMLVKVKTDQHLAKTIGSWAGRQVEENTAQKYNNALIDALHQTYVNEFKTKPDQFINLDDEAELEADPVLADALRLMNFETREYIQSKFGNEGLWVRRDMLKDAFGYRSASIGDAWTGNSRWSKETQQRVKEMLIGFGGNEMYRRLVNGEGVLQNFVKDARVLIVVKSMIVPAGNFVSNIFQMISRGIPLADIARGLPRKTAEVNAYTKSRLREIEADAELRAAIGSKDVVAQRKLRSEIQSIKDSYKRMSIWPLIEAGEFSSVSDAGISRDEILLSEGRLHAYMEQLVSKLPASMQTAGRYALITKDTALFQGLQKAVEYGDFLAKAIVYDDLVKRQKKSKEYALGRVTEEFVNYDRLSGRFRGYLESVGMLWFYNFKLRSTKVAASMIRNNPLHALMGGMLPSPNVLGVGTPIEDNIVTKLLDGSLWRSWGLGQGLSAPMLNPWAQMIR
jgi:hypothetical protein